MESPDGGPRRASAPRVDDAALPRDDLIRSDRALHQIG
jgi:hypothetical protein